ncbi:hypothetical protein [Isoptericola aurantiacus]|uniref:hypothetical protein n=1 Tax=Isoptericola aurantiacus TaxID=3377839 RepID=UPI00383BE98A
MHTEPTPPEVGTPAVMDQLVVSMPDVAEIAQVERPVVSTWRRRYAAADRPFPAPVAEGPDGSLRFRAVDVADWVEATGRGNNPHFRADVALRASFAVTDPDRARRLQDGLAAMFCLKDLAERPLGDLDADDLLDLADELDPEDAFLYTETADLGRDLRTAAELADLAADAAYTPGRAADALADGHHRARRQVPASALVPTALRLAARVAAQIHEDGPVADPYPGAGDLLRAVLAAHDGIDVPTALLPRGHRAARRRLVAHGWDVGTLTADGATPLPPGDALVVSQLPPTGSPEQPVLEVLAQLEELVLGLGEHQRAVVVGPANALTDALDGAAESVRSGLLRTEKLRAVVLLPPGMIVDRSRQRLALWVLGAPPSGVAIAERWTMVADLSDRSVPELLDATIVEDLLTDVAASLGGPRDVASHAFRFARFVRMAPLLAAGGSIVAAGRRPISGIREDDGATALRIRELGAALDGGPRPPLGLAVRRSAATGVRRAPLWALTEQRRLKQLAGNRVDPDLVVDAPSRDAALLRVVGVPELTGQREWGTRGVDRLRLVASNPSGRLTEPGDVVFTVAPYPVAVVDHDGFSVVEYPAQILRVLPPAPTADGVTPDAVVVPAVLARDVTAQPSGAKWWRAWETRLVPADQADEVARVLRTVSERAAAARRELLALDELAGTLADGVTAGVVGMRLDGGDPL